MFPIELGEVPYQDPWLRSIDERLAQLAKGEQRVAYFYESPNNSTFRYRAYNMVTVINQTVGTRVSADYFFLSDSAHLSQIVDLADVLVVCRSRYEYRLNHWITRFKNRGKRVLFDVDDLVFNPSHAHMIMNTLAQDSDVSEVWDYWFSYLSRMQESLKLCDGAITTNAYLGQQITSCTGLPVEVVPNFMNEEQLTISNTIFQSKKSSNFAKQGSIVLGYFSGSPSHKLDYAMVEPAIAQVMGKDDRVQLMLAGYIEPEQALAPFGGRIQRVPFSDYVNLQRWIGSVDFNLVPLQSNIFTNCKSELKYFEAAALGTPTIASPTFTYANAIEDGVNGRLAKAHEWADVIMAAIDEEDRYPEMAIKAHDHALAHYAWDKQYNTVMKALGLS
jgi:glycosyltransferase involved in cell wall biosynthesis